MCGIFSVVSSNPISEKKVIDGLKDLQHRGRDSFGVSYLTDDKIRVVKETGLVKELNIKEHSKCWVGHTRYSTSSNDTIFTQPVFSEKNNFTICHNGNIPEKVWDRVKEKYKNLKFKEEISDTFKLKYFIDFLLEKYDFSSVLKKIVEEVTGVYSLVIQTKNRLFLVRDRYGVKPLEICKTENTIIVSSEAFFGVSNGLLPTIEPGSVYSVDYKTQEVLPVHILKTQKIANCVFEYIYFLKDKSIVNGKHVKNFREQISKILKKDSEHKFSKLDKSNVLVSGVPNSGNVYGKTFATEMGFKYSQFLDKRKDYHHRTFILPTDEERIVACQKKYIVTENIKGKIIFLADDSIVRGNTIKYLIKYLKNFEPKEIHLIVGSPPVRKPCFYGVDFPDIEELVINRMSAEELRENLEIDTLTYFDVEKLNELGKNFCTACFTGEYLF